MNTVNLWCLLCFYCLFVFSFPKGVLAEVDEYDVVEEKLEQLNAEMMEQLQLDELQDYWEGLQQEYGMYIEDLTTKSLIDLIKDKESISFKSIARGVITFLLYEIISNGRL